MDPLAITGALAATHHAFNLCRGIADQIKESGKSELMSQFMELQGAMMELQIKQQGLIQEIEELRSQCKELREQLEVNAKLECHHDLYWIKAENGKFDGPFSPNSWDTDRQLARIGVWNCYRKGDSCYVDYRCVKTSYTYTVPFGWMKQHYGRIIEFEENYERGL